MTILPTHSFISNSHLQKSSVKSIKVNGNVTGTANGYINGVGVHGSLPHVTTPSASASLLAEFIEAYKELSSYRSV
jgi:hypothetical protein